MIWLKGMFRTSSKVSLAVMRQGRPNSRSLGSKFKEACRGSWSRCRYSLMGTTQSSSPVIDRTRPPYRTSTHAGEYRGDQRPVRARDYQVSSEPDGAVHQVPLNFPTIVASHPSVLFRTGTKGEPGASTDLDRRWAVAPTVMTWGHIIANATRDRTADGLSLSVDLVPYLSVRLAARSLVASVRPWTDNWG